MTTSLNQVKLDRSATETKTGPEIQRNERRRQLLAEECAKLGVRFLPAQVMRRVYEREGVL